MEPKTDPRKLPGEPPQGQRAACAECRRAHPWQRWCAHERLPLAELLERASGGLVSAEAARAELGAAADYCADGRPTVPRPPAPRPSSHRGPERAYRAELLAHAECRTCGQSSCGCEQARPKPRRPRPLPPQADDRRGSAEREARAAAFAEHNRERGCPKFAPLDWTAQQYARARYLMTYASAAQRAWRRLPPRLRAFTERACLAMERDDRGFLKPSRTWRHVRARRTLAVLVTIWEASSPSKLRGDGRVLRGYTRGSFASLFINQATGNPYSLGTIFNTSHDAHRRGWWDCGDAVALERAGALWWTQPPASTQPVQFVGRDRFGDPRAINEYHFSDRTAHGTDEPPDGPEPEPPLEDYPEPWDAPPAPS